MDWILNRTIKQRLLGVSIGEETFTDLDSAVDVTLLAESLETLVLQEEAAPLNFCKLIGQKRKFSTPGSKA